MHTEAQPYFSPSSQTSLIWAQVDSCLSRVWSQWARMFFTSIRLLLLNSATFFIAIWICFSLRNSAKAIAVTAVTTFVLSLYLGFGMMLKFPVAFLPTYQIREAVTSTAIFQPFPILIGIVWVVTLLILSWCSFRKCELK